MKPRDNKTVKSPCIGICLLSENVCLGCYRTAEEIANWMYMTNEQKLKSLKRINENN